MVLYNGLNLELWFERFAKGGRVDGNKEQALAAGEMTLGRFRRLFGGRELQKPRRARRCPLARGGGFPGLAGQHHGDEDSSALPYVENFHHLT